MPLARVDPSVPIWVDASDARGACRTLIGLRGPLGDQRMLIEIDERGEVALRHVDRVDAEARERAAAPKSRGVLRRVGAALTWVAVVLAIAAGSGLASGLLQARVVQTGSMASALRAGDVYVGVTTSMRMPEVGDVVLFTARRFDGTAVAPFTHRIVGGSAEDGFVTKGDANRSADALDVRLADIESVGILTIPYGGVLVSLRPVLIALLAIGLGLLLRGDRR